MLKALIRSSRFSSVLRELPLSLMARAMATGLGSATRSTFPLPLMAIGVAMPIRKSDVDAGLGSAVIVGRSLLVIIPPSIR